MSDNDSENTIFMEMANLEEKISEDVTGDQTRRLLKYFAGIARATEVLQQSSRDEGQRHLAGRLLQGFRAAEKIVREVWETIHGVVLVQ